ncbi:hypothetical protein [Ornithinibacillus sp. 179-J 7C1 HS]|uniref:hypothetical protein n=1 Tax=Ornithinibacillus sp. 179-J 7C1 HS TaxID=3142384 RepID=UPI0039A13244
MSLTNTSLVNIVMKQLRYKLKAYIGVLLALILAQVLGIFIATLAASVGSVSNGFYSIEVESYSSNVVIGFTLIWAFMNAILISTKAYREDDFTFVANRLSYNFSNILFIITISTVGAVTAFLSNGIIQIVVYFTSDVEFFLTLGESVEPFHHGLGLVSTFLYVLLFAITGYLIGMMVQVSKLFLLLIPICLFAIGYLEQGGFGFGEIVGFYFLEQSFPLFVIKSLITILICGSLAILLSNRLEVR